MKGWRRVFVGMSVLSLLSPGTGFADGPATSSAYVPEPYDTANVAQGKTASMIGGTPAAGRGPEGGIDYDFTTFVQSDQNVAWDYKLDLGASHSVKEVKFTSDSVHYATSYSVKVSTDGANYAEVAADVVDEGGVTKRYTFPATDARYILIDVATTAGDAGHIVREVEVYDETAAPNVAYVFSYHKDEPGPPSNLHYNYAIESLQGLVNRDGPKLFLKRSNYWADGYWNEDWIERYATDYGIAFQEFACPTPDPATGDCLVADYEAVLKKFRDKLSGIAIYDTQVDGSAQVALTLAGTDGVLPVPDYLYTDWLPALAGLPILYDFRGDFANSVEAYRWALEEGGVMQKTDRMHAHTPAGPNVDGKLVGGGPYRAIDWNVMHKGFQFNLTFNYVETDSFGGTRIAGDKAQADMYRRILGELEPGALIVGYGEFENDWFDLLSDYNVDYLHWGDNMSFHNKVPALGALKQKRHVREDDIQLQDYQEKYLVAFVTSEGDTLKGPLTSYFDTWKSEGRGAVPYNWMLSPLMVHFPAMTEYYYRNATDLDYFGAFDILRFPHSHLADVGAKMRADMEAIDLTSLSGYSSFSLPAEWKALADMTNAQGFADIDWGTIRGPGLSVTPNGRPYIVQDNMVSYWQAQVYGWGTKWNDKPRAVLAQDLANQIRNAARKHPAPYPIVVYGDIHEYPELLTMYRDVMNLLDPAAFKAVRLDEAFAVMEKKRMKSNLAYGKTATMLGGSPGWGHVPSKALDGELGSYVQSDQDVLWDLRIDLGGVQEIT
ncbi:MAG TPA: discoidin domain-containing protein, partial [Paenibacillus sp.]|nr:discoidin domain-containing protein [Paenibacillus sp.]